MQKKAMRKLYLNKETLRDLSERNLKGVVGGWTFTCGETQGLTACIDCGTVASCEGTIRCQTDGC